MAIFGRDSTTFRNWAGTVEVTPERFLRPSSESEVADIVREAYRRKGQVKVVGAGHSWNDVAASRDTMLSLDALDAVLDVDHATRQVTVQAGIRLKDLIEELDVRGLALDNLGSVTEQSLAGAISTGTHGTGLAHGALPTQMVRFRMVNGQGTLMDVDPDTAPALFHAASVGVGALGIITQITLQAEAAYDIEERSWALPWDEALNQAQKLWESHSRVKFWWLPHTEMVQVYTYEKTTRPRQPASAFEQRLDRFMNDRVFGAILGIGQKIPSAVPTLNKLVGASYFKAYERVDRYDRCLALAMPPAHLENEYGIHVDDTVEVMDRVHSLVEGGGYSVGFINEVRFVRADENWLSGSYGRNSCQFGAYTPDGRDARAYLEGVEDIAYELGGRPHWGKDFHADPGHLREVFPRFDDFCELRRELDPAGVFANDFVTRVFGP